MSFIIPDRAKVDFEIPKSKIDFSENVVDDILDVKWIGTIKPCIMGVEPVVAEDKRFEEIQIMSVNITTVENIYEIGKCIFKSVKYPVILKVCYEEKYLIGVCIFKPGKIDSNENVLSKIQYSHWIHEDLMSKNASKLLDVISETLKEESNLYDIYKTIEQAIVAFKISGTNKAHINRLLNHMLGAKYDFDEIMKYATPVKIYGKVGSHYSSKRTTSFTYCYDYEELWYCFMKNERTARVITNRRYRDIEDLIFSINERLEVM